MVVQQRLAYPWSSVGQSAVGVECRPRLVYGSRKYDHVTSRLHDLLWLRAPELIGLLYRVSMEFLRHTWLMNFTVWLTSSHDSGCVQSNYGADRAIYSTLHDRQPFLSCSTRVRNWLPQQVTSSMPLTVFGSVSRRNCYFMLLFDWPYHFRIFIAFSWQLFMFFEQRSWSTPSIYGAVQIVVYSIINNNIAVPRCFIGH